MHDEHPFDIYLAAVERIIGFPYAEVVVSTVEECFEAGVGVDVCADRLMADAEEAQVIATEKAERRGIGS